MDSTQAPNNLEQWVELLHDKPLPIPARTVVLLKRQLEDPKVSLKQLSPIIDQDPVLTMHCVSLANRLNRNPDTDVATTELALATIGMDHLLTLLTELPALKLNSASVAHKQYYHALADSYHAAELAASLCRYKDPAMINKTRFAALFYAVGQWALWRYAPAQASQIKIRMFERQQDSALAEHEVLGCTLQQLSEQLVNHWQLSTLAETALQHQTSPDAQLLEHTHQQAEHAPELSDEQRRAVKQLRNAHHYPVKLANWFYLTANRGWNTPKLNRIRELISDFLEQPLDDSTALVHRNCAQSSRSFPMPGLLSPAAQLLLQPSKLVLNYRLDQQDLQPNQAKQLGSAVSPADLAKKAEPCAPETQPSATSNKASDQHRDPARFNQALSQLQTRLTPEQLNESLLDGLVAGLGLARVVIYHINFQMRLTPSAHQGLRQDDLLVQLTLNLEVPSLLNKMLKKPSCLLVNQSNRAKAWNQLPERFTSRCHQAEFLLGSILTEQHPGFIVYADMGEQPQALGAFQRQQFNLLIAAAGQCLNP